MNIPDVLASFSSSCRARSRLGRSSKRLVVGEEDEMTGKSSEEHQTNLAASRTEFSVPPGKEKSR